MTQDQAIIIAAKDTCMLKYYHAGITLEVWNLLVNQTIKELNNMDDEELLAITDLYVYQ